MKTFIKAVAATFILVCGAFTYSAKAEENTPVEPEYKFEKIIVTTNENGN